MKSVILLVACILCFSCEKDKKGDHNKNEITWTEFNIPGMGVVYSFSFDNKGLIYAATSNGVYVSEDNGTNWTKILNATQFINMQVNQENEIYVNAPGFLLKKSSDGGHSWKTLQPVSYQKHFSYYVTLDNANTVYVSQREGKTLYMYYEGSGQWDSINFEEKIYDIQYIDNQFYLTTTDFHIWKIRVMDNRFQTITEMGPFDQPSVNVTKGNDGNLYFSMHPHIYQLKGDSTVMLNDADTTGFGYSHLLVSQENNLFSVRSVSFPAEYYPSVVYYSPDKGNSWKPVGPEGEYIYSIAMGPTNQLFIGSITQDGSARVFRSSLID